MAIPRLSSCCCGCTLRTGTQIIGILEAIFLTIYLITAITFASYFDNPSNYPGYDPSDIKILYGLYITIAVVTSIQLLCSILLLFGVSKRNPSLFKPWLIFAVINIIEAIVIATLNSIVYAASGYITGLVGYAIGAGLILFLKIYFILVVYNHYLEVSGDQGIPEVRPYDPYGNNMARNA